MKHFLLLSAAALSLSAVAQQPVPMASLPSLKPASLNDYQLQSAMGESVKAPAQQAAESPVVSQQPAGELRTYVRKGEGVMSYLGGIDKGPINGMTMEIVFAEDGQTIWFHGLISTSQSTSYWLRGTLEGDKITLAPDQTTWYYDYGTYYTSYPVSRIKFNPEGSSATYDIYEVCEGDITFTLSADGTITLDADPVTGEAAIGLVRETTDDFCIEYGLAGKWLGYGDENTVFEPIDVAFNTLPDGLATQTYSVSFSTDASGSRTVEMVEVAQQDNNVYVGGLLKGICDDAWLIGQIQGDKVIFPSNQMIGIYDNYYIYYAGGDVVEMDGELYVIPNEQLTFDYDAATGTMKTDQYLSVTVYPDDPAIIYGLWAPELKPFVEVPATPATPTIGEEYYPYDEWYMSGTITMTVPCVDINGEPLNPEKLSIAFYINGKQVTFSPDVYWGVPEEMTELPYGFDDGYQITQLGGGYMAIQFMDPEAETFAVKSIYRGGDELHESAMDYYPEAPVAVENVEAQKANTVVYDIMGRRQTVARGLCVENGKTVLR